MGAMREGAVRSGVRKGVAEGVTVEEIEQVIALATGTIGLPSAVACWKSGGVRPRKWLTEGRSSARLPHRYPHSGVCEWFLDVCTVAVLAVWRGTHPRALMFSMYTADLRASMQLQSDTFRSLASPAHCCDRRAGDD